MPDIAIKLDLSDDQFIYFLEMMKPVAKPGPMIERWLESIPPTILEGLWLSAGDDMATPKAVSFQAALLARLHADSTLW